MNGTDPTPLWRLEPGWLLAGLGWGAFLGLGTTSARLLLWMSGGGIPELDDTLLVPVLWFVLLATTGAVYGGLAGMVLGVVLMLAVGRDPQVRAARRTGATVTLLTAPLVLMALLWFV